MPPDSAPNGSVPVGVKPLSCSTLSLSSRNTENTLAILPMARILFLITSFRAAAIIGCDLSIGGDDGVPMPPCARVVQLLCGSIVLLDYSRVNNLPADIGR